MTTTQVPTAGSRQTGLEEGASAAAEAMARVLPSDQVLTPDSPMAASQLDPTGWPAG